MRIYSAENEELLLARKYIKHWSAEGALTEAQSQLLQPETTSDLRTTNLFLRLVLFFFTVLALSAAIALLFTVFLSRPSETTSGVFFLIFAVASCIAAEVAVSQASLYRYGIEEALLLCSIALLYVGMHMICGSSAKPPATESLIPAICALYSLALWHRFGLWYMLPSAMLFVGLLPVYWTQSFAAQHLITVALYGVALALLVRAGRPHRSDYLRNHYSLGEALLWLGIYLTLNLKLSAFSGFEFIGRVGPYASFEPPNLFYWITWVLIWCLPGLIIARGIRQKDRFILDAGALAALLTLITNKPYLGWPRHTWDPMLLGVLLAGIVFYLRRWLARGPEGVRNGFTVASLTKRDKGWMNAGSAVVGFATPTSPAPQPQTTGPDVHMGGGASGGAGASRDF